MSKNEDLIDKSFQLMEEFGKSLRDKFVLDNDTTQAKTNSFITSLTNPSNRGNVMKYLFAILSIFLIVLFYCKHSSDRSALTSNFYFYLWPMTFLLLANIYFLYGSKRPDGNVLHSAFTLGMGTLVLALVIYFYSTLNSEQVSSMMHITFVLLSIGVVAGLAIVFYFFSNALKRSEGLSGLIINLIFYLPCLLIDFINYIRKEFNDTTHPVYYLFIIELLVVLGYFYIPKLVNKFFFKKGVKLLPDSLFLDSEHVLSGSDRVQKLSPKVFDVKDPEYRKNYSISMWIYLNDQPENYAGYAKETNIFNYANGAPKITYEYENTEDDEENEKIHVYFTNNNELSSNVNLKMSTKVKKQRWNHFVVNYNSHYADLFINGKLENSVNLSMHTPTYSPSDTIQIGSSDGLDGAIANITYYPDVMSKTQIANEYTLLRNKKPPVELF